MDDLMVDIETLGTTHNAVITQIGACFFDRNTGDYGSNFLMNIRIQDCLDKGMTVNGDTIKWWMNQEYKSWVKDAGDLAVVLNAFRKFAKPCKAAWAHATFDFPILANAYNICKIGMPFHYRDMRDLITLVDLSDLKKEDFKTNLLKTHNALDDCFYQIEYAVKCFKRIKE